MNPVVRHFLPSVVRGVYRVDDEFSNIKDARAYSRFVDAKLRFIPPDMARKFQKQFSFESSYARTQRQLTLWAGQINPTHSTQRANTFFLSHPYFQNARGTNPEITGADNYLEIQFVRKVMAPLLNDEGMRLLLPQHRIGPYFADFALAGASNFALEVDGFGKFKQRSDLDDFMGRQNYITSQGWRVMRFPYAHIVENPALALKTLHALFRADPQARRLLAGQQQAELVLDQFAGTEGPQVIDFVNDFHRVQDHYAEAMLTAYQASGPFHVRDDFKLGVPFVALAISALYDFLEAVQSVVDVDFMLPAVEVEGAQCSLDWASHLHRLVRPAEVQLATATVCDASSVQFTPASLPTPPLGSGKFRFRKGLALEEIRQRLQYFCSAVFGYKETKYFQNTVLQRVFNGQDVLGISATGSGKSFCFWLPALLRPGLTLIICPLRSLMRDQHLTLRNYGIASAAFINADNSQEHLRIMEEARLGYVRLIYISPERLRIKKFLAELALLQNAVPIHFLAVDEAHCISEWGHDFRPSYLKLPFLRKTLSVGNDELQLIALTATAGEKVEKDMLGILKLRAGEDGHVARDRGADRPNFSYQIVCVQPTKTKTETYQEILTTQLPKALRQKSLPDLLRLVNQREEKAVGIVFCIYADPHGKHSIHDGVAHYLFETMGAIEPDKRFESRRGWKAYREDAFSTGKVRAFSSKTPTLCPRCNCYQYTSTPSGRSGDDDEEIGDDDGPVGAAQPGGRKVCANCGHEFDGDQPFKPARWEKLIKENQVDFKESDFDVLVATKGFGMGIDKSSVRFVVHTSLSSGIESWYQEIGRAGRDDERAHVVLLVDPPTEACRKELGENEFRIPACKSYGHCPRGRDSLCDYGKQHMFIKKSYPGAESDAVSALKVLDKLIVAREGSIDGSVMLGASHENLSRTEIAVYRLTLLGLVDDYVVTYQKNPRFEVEFTLPTSPDRPDALVQVQAMMRGRLAEYFSHFGERRGRDIERELAKRIQDYQPLENYAAKTRTFATFVRYERLFKLVYRHLLLQLDQTYKDVVKMRYDMLWNLQTLVTSQNCRRIQILPHFGDSIEETYQCGCCDVCSPSLDFLETRVPPLAHANMAEKESELAIALSGESFDRAKLIRLIGEFADYPTAKYRQARSVVEHDGDSLPALFLAREFSPPEEYAGNAKGLLRKANQKSLPLPEISDLFRSTRGPKSDLLLTLNEADTSCDSASGWRFLAEEAAKPEHHVSAEIGTMHECLDFMLLVEEDLADKTEKMKRKARELEKAFYA